MQLGSAKACHRARACRFVSAHYLSVCFRAASSLDATSLTGLPAHVLQRGKRERGHEEDCAWCLTFLQKPSLMAVTAHHSQRMPVRIQSLCLSWCHTPRLSWMSDIWLLSGAFDIEDDGSSEHTQPEHNPWLSQDLTCSLLATLPKPQRDQGCLELRAFSSSSSFQSQIVIVQR